jgi:hypothetical protein
LAIKHDGTIGVATDRLFDIGQGRKMIDHQVVVLQSGCERGRHFGLVLHQ